MISLHEPTISGKEKKYVKDCIDSTWISTSGKYINLFEKKITKYTKSKFAVALNSGTSALQISLKVLRVMPGDEVIVPTITFIAPVNAIIYNKAIPVFMDVDNHFNIDVKKTKDFLEKCTFSKKGFTYNKKSKNKISAIIVVHTFGNLADINSLVKICKKKNIKIIEDAAESLGSFYKSTAKKFKHSGTIGSLGCLSFNGNKILTCGGGGMILTNKKSLADKAKYLSTQAKDDPINFVHHDVGYNYRMTNIHAAIGVAQLEKINKFLSNKQNIKDQYLKKISNISGILLIKSPEYSKSNNWLNLIRINKRKFKKNKKQLIKIFFKNAVQVRPVWYPNHLQKPYKMFETFKITNALKLVDSTLCLPSSSHLKNSEISKIVSILKK